MAELKIKADSGGGTVSFKGPATTTSNAAVQLTLPVDDGTANQYLKTDGSGALSWDTVSSVGGATGADFNDDVKIRLGTGNDLEIYHSGSNSHIKDSGTGHLQIDGSRVQLRNVANDDPMVDCTGGGTVELYHNGSKKLNTWAYGLEVYSDNPHITMKTSNGTSRGNIYADDSNYIGFLDDGGNWVLKCKKSTETFLYVSNFAPSNDDSNHIGTSSYRWDNIYATNGTIQTSDRNEKNTIVDSDLGLPFINKLKPVSYKFNGKTRTHYGLIAQDVETVLEGKDFAGFIKSDIPESKYEEKEDIPSGKSVGDVKTAAHTSYGLRYNEFIGPLVKAVQELSAEVETLKTKVAALEAG